MIDWNNFESKLQKRGSKAELSRQTGISTGNIRDWFNPDKTAQPGADALVKISKALDCSVDYLLGLTDVEKINNETITIYKLPVYQQDVAAGAGQLGFDQKHEMEEFSEINMPKKISYGIKIKGNSMETDDENNIPDGSTVLVTTELEYDELVGEAVVVNINGNLICKEYNIAEDGHLWLKSRNRNKANEDRNIYDLDGVKIIGRVVKVIGL